MDCLALIPQVERKQCAEKISAIQNLYKRQVCQFVYFCRLEQALPV